MGIQFSSQKFINFFRSGQFKIWLGAFWLVVTFSMVSWWFYNSFYLINNLLQPEFQEKIHSVNELHRYQRMIFWEGLFLLFVILVGGLFLIWYVKRDHERHEKLKFFFANFTHDIKTSIARLKLQTELISEDLSQFDEKSLQRLMNDLSRLDLQLENSLLLTQIDESILLQEQYRLSDLIEALKIEYPQLKIDLLNNAEIEADLRSLRSIIRNIFENALRHGRAKKIEISVFEVEPSGIKIIFSDDGVGAQTDIAQIGQGLTPFSNQKSNGIGLYLAKKIMRKMHGDIQFKHRLPHGFQVKLFLKGHAL